jgi:hypothetical protein
MWIQISPQPLLVLLQIFSRNIVLWNLTRANFLLVVISRVFHPSHYTGLKGVALFQ